MLQPLLTVAFGGNSFSRVHAEFAIGELCHKSKRTVIAPGMVLDVNSARTSAADDHLDQAPAGDAAPEIEQQAEVETKRLVASGSRHVRQDGEKIEHVAEQDGEQVLEQTGGHWDECNAPAKAKSDVPPRPQAAALPEQTRWLSASASDGPDEDIDTTTNQPEGRDMKARHGSAGKAIPTNNTQVQSRRDGIAMRKTTVVTRPRGRRGRRPSKVC